VQYPRQLGQLGPHNWTCNISEKRLPLPYQLLLLVTAFLHFDGQAALLHPETSSSFAPMVSSPEVLRDDSCFLPAAEPSEVVVMLQMYHLYWPLLTNSSEHLEVRVAALTVLILFRPTSTRLYNVMLSMMHEQDPHLKHFWYTTLHSLVHTRHPCYRHL
jgi:hypothetical protein